MPKHNNNSSLEIKLIKNLLLDIICPLSESRLKKTLTKHLADINWPKLMHFLIYHELYNFFLELYKKENFKIPKQVKDILVVKNIISEKRYLILKKEFLFLAEASDKKNIKLVPMKGLGYEENFYPKNILRPITDIDLFVLPENLYFVEKILLSKGYEYYEIKGNRQYWEKHNNHLVFQKNNDDNFLSILELHWNFDYHIKWPTSILKEIYDFHTLDKGTHKVFKPHINLICVVLHQRRFGKVLNLKYLLDFVLLAKDKKIDKTYIKYFVNRFELKNCFSFFYFQAKKLLDVDFLWIKKIIGAKKSYPIRFFERNCNNWILDFSQSNSIEQIKKYYLMVYFCLFDRILQPIYYILNIPYEQFAKFFSLSTDKAFTKFLYQFKLFIFPFYGMWHYFYNLVKKTYSNIKWLY